MTKIVQPILLGYLIRYFSLNSDVTTQQAYLYASGLGVTAIFIGIVHHPYFYRIQTLGMGIRVATCGMIYQKVGAEISARILVNYCSRYLKTRKFS